MEIGAAAYGPVRVLRPEGAIDVTTCAAFEARLLAALPASDPAVMLVVDLSRVPFLSSAGLRAIMVGAKQARATGASLAVAALTPAVGEIYEISRFHHVVPAFDDVAGAIAAMSAEGAAAYLAARSPG